MKTKKKPAKNHPWRMQGGTSEQHRSTQNKAFQLVPFGARMGVKS